jgi:lipopolysaccharide/colanic/teichoic acid biosynthesis glycosyltransferase
VNSKRLFDFACLVAALPLFGPPMLIIAAAIKLDDRGDVLFRQIRLGLHLRPFRIFKFRTMRDGNVTRVGRWLRNTGLDELPQFLNVLRSEMSIVGPRPLSVDDVVRLGWTEGEMQHRWDVRPGITGLAQIHGGRGAKTSGEDDLAYVRRSSFALDARIVLVSLAINLLGKKRVREWFGSSVDRIVQAASAGRRGEPAPEERKGSRGQV